MFDAKGERVMSDYDQGQVTANQEAWAAQNQARRRYPTAEEQLEKRLLDLEHWLGNHTPEKVAEKQAEAERIRVALKTLKGE